MAGDTHEENIKVLAPLLIEVVLVLLLDPMMVWLALDFGFSVPISAGGAFAIWGLLLVLVLTVAMWRYLLHDDTAGPHKTWVERIIEGRLGSHSGGEEK